MRALRCIEATICGRLVARENRAAQVRARGAALLEAVVVISTLLLLFAVAPIGYQRYEAAFFRSRVEDVQRWTRALSGCGQLAAEVLGVDELSEGSTTVVRGPVAGRDLGLMQRMTESIRPKTEDGRLPCNPEGTTGSASFAANRAPSRTLVAD